MLRAVGDQIYDVKVSMDVMEIKTHETGLIKEHVTFLLHIGDSENHKNETLMTSLSTMNNNTHPNTSQQIQNCSTLGQQMILDVETFCDIFPFHVLFNSSLDILQCGNKIQILSGDVSSLEVGSLQ